MEASLSQLSMHHAELALRMIVAVVLGGVIGMERTLEDRYFGLRIHMLTSLAAAGFSIAALEAVAGARLQNIDADPFRVLQAVVSGLALLAAGTIIKGDGQVKGLTTGVGLWLAGGVVISAIVGWSIYSFLNAAAPTEAVLVATRDIPAYSAVQPNDFTTEMRPKVAVPADALKERSGVAGMVAQGALLKGDVVRAGHLTKQQGSPLSAKLSLTPDSARPLLNDTLITEI